MRPEDEQDKFFGEIEKVAAELTLMKKEDSRKAERVS